MTVRSSARNWRLLLVLALAAPVAAPAAAGAAGFGTPVTISGPDDAGEPQVAVAPNGRTAVIYARDPASLSRPVYRLALGSSPDRLGHPKTLRLPGVPSGARLGGLQLSARRDGGFVLCLTQGKQQDCSIAPPTAGFGPLIPLPGKARDLTPVVRPDGSTLLLRSVTHYRHQLITGTTLTTQVLGADGRLAPELTVTRSREEQSYNVNTPQYAVLDDGTVAIAANTSDPAHHDGTRLGIRLLAPGSDTFGPVVPVPGTPSDNNIILLGGPMLTIAYRASPSGDGNGPYEQRAVTQLPGGTFGPTLTVPDTASSDLFNTSATVVPLPSGGLFSVSSRIGFADGDQDCYNPVDGTVAGGPLAPVGQPGSSVQLSTRGQIAWHEQAAALADGTIIAAWHDGVNENGARRVDTAVRLPGAATFSRPQRLPRLISYGEPDLVAAGDHAALVWLAAGDHDRASIVVSTYRTAAPYAKFVPPARHPGTSCDE